VIISYFRVERMLANSVSEAEDYGSRAARPVPPRAMYHAMSRGGRLEAVFCDEADGMLFVAALAESLEKTALGIQSVCLMSNHFHLMVETPNANLVEGMKRLLGVLEASCQPVALARRA
jgi:REP element-mobilizing transposase RayT